MKNCSLRSLGSLALAAVLISACAPTLTDSTPVPVIHSPTVEAGPTPLPDRTRHPPGELFEYSAQSGDTLPALAAHFNTSVEEILAANPDLPGSVTTLPPGYPMLIPMYYVPLLGSPFHILPDSEVIYGPSASEFDFSKEIRQRPGFLAGLSDFAYQKQRPAWEVVEVIARNYSVNPRLLLALMEYQTQALSQPFPAGDEDIYVLDVRESRYTGLFWQLIWAGERINDGYYGWRAGTLQEFELKDGLLVRPDPWLNAGTAAIQFVFAGLYGKEGFDHAVSPEGFFQTYTQLWGDPFDQAIELIPTNLQQPEMTLPFLPNRIWDFTAGPHFSWGKALPLGALDFGPPAEESGCVPSMEWIAAPTAGLIVRSGEAIVVLDLDGDGDERTGWALFFFHVATQDRIEEGMQVLPGEPLGHPSCEGGRATGTHFHLARRYNGEWIPAAGVIPFILEGWVTAYGDEPYQGTLTKGSKVVPASEVSTFENRILYELPG
ncbi:MAG: LysM peptidoglycan-binding domain-containing protein [Anaerolineales bacterium]|nr:LysM peptidoglycan-binding domain-containing protein [Anaerolineales bacterium]